MPLWPKSTGWTSPSAINANRQYNPNDGCTAEDINTIIKNLIYLKNSGDFIYVLSIDAKVEGTKLILTES